MRCRLLKRVIPLLSPLATANGQLTHRQVWVLVIDDGTGRVGLGEAAPLDGFGSESPALCREAFTKALSSLTADFLVSWLDRGRPDAPLGPLEKILAGAPCARQAIEGALTDLMAKQQEKSLARLLTETPSATVPVNALLGGSLSDVVTAAAELTKMGYTCFKLKVGGATTSVGQDIERVFAVRDAIGTKAGLRVDANAGWKLDQALEFAIEIADANLEFCEQPLAANDLDGLATLRRRTGIKIAVDESVRTATDIGKVAAAQAADVVVLKPMFLGGWRPTLQAAQLAKSCGLGVVVTTALESAVGRALATHYAAALGITDRAHGLATGILLAEDVTSAPLLVANGRIAIPDLPGLGIGALRG